MADPELRRALQITSAWLMAICKTYELDECMRPTVHHEGEVIASTTLGEAMEIANAALEQSNPEPSADHGSIIQRNV